MEVSMWAVKDWQDVVLIREKKSFTEYFWKATPEFVYKSTLHWIDSFLRSQVSIGHVASLFVRRFILAPRCLVKGSACLFWFILCKSNLRLQGLSMRNFLWNEWWMISFTFFRKIIFCQKDKVMKCYACSVVKHWRFLLCMAAIILP